MNLGKEAIARASRYGRPLSAFMLDLDHFKHINDAYGHRAGDLMLQTFSKVLLKTLRTTDIIGRVGGEEFAVLLPDTELAEAIETAYRLKNAIAQQSVSIDNAIILRGTTSIGVGSWRPGVDLDDLLDMADSALYQAKQSGRNKVCIAQQPELAEVFSAKSA
jgi:diguanylate cyclase (GGDEF)-like protein